MVGKVTPSTGRGPRKISFARELESLEHVQVMGQLSTASVVDAYAVEPPGQDSCAGRGAINSDMRRGIVTMDGAQRSAGSRRFGANDLFVPDEVRAEVFNICSASQGSRKGVCICFCSASTAIHMAGHMV